MISTDGNPTIQHFAFEQGYSSQPVYPPGPQPQYYSSKPPSPSYPSPFPQHPLENPPLRRDVGDDDATRSNSAEGYAPDALPHISHPITASNPPQPLQLAVIYPPVGHQRYMGYQNGSPVPPPLGAGCPTNCPPPTPTPAQKPSYESYDNYPPASDPLYGAYISSEAAKRKNMRASLACDQCRQLKAKCDETKPCKTCRDKRTECVYRDPVPKGTDKAQADILNAIQTVKHLLTGLIETVRCMDSKMTQLDGTVARLESNVGSRPNDDCIKMDCVADEEPYAPPRSSFCNGLSPIWLGLHSRLRPGPRPGPTNKRD
ncbi:Zn(2)-Cys(6) zinc finger domain protein [Metarhizium robertsii]|uniref:Zn(2)-C6 fungal-type domain-containing protein n=2 Tax=Metarhizium robertsii TaxID=568076 RepID=A0A0B2XDC9_METRA|nr:uncharacterized protein MAA_11693 [Metarhizium robertsii ARSEF 23]EXU95193.1 Zn(2)-Cys(6) zinc finger domain protein [Metarhizium robertsii]KHO10735.1 hypothetical protein MAA_11693 [Metarhizium robertsii ARSEF 23]